MLDAILRTLFRMSVTRRKLLEWETAAATEQRLSRRWSTLRHMWYVPVLALGLVYCLPREALAAAAPLLFAWCLAPAAAQVINRPITIRSRQGPGRLAVFDHARRRNRSPRRLHQPASPSARTDCP